MTDNEGLIFVDILNSTGEEVMVGQLRNNDDPCSKIGITLMDGNVVRDHRRKYLDTEVQLIANKVSEALNISDLPTNITRDLSETMLSVYEEHINNKHKRFDEITEFLQGLGIKENVYGPRPTPMMDMSKLAKIKTLANNVVFANELVPNPTTLHTQLKWVLAYFRASTEYVKRTHWCRHELCSFSLVQGTSGIVRIETRLDDDKGERVHYLPSRLSDLDAVLEIERILSSFEIGIKHSLMFPRGSDANCLTIYQSKTGEWYSKIHIGIGYGVYEGEEEIITEITEEEAQIHINYITAIKPHLNQGE